MSKNPYQGENIKTVKLVRSSTLGFGLTVTWGGTILQGAFIESVLAGGPADGDGNLSPGDHILMVNGVDVRNHQFLDVADLIRNAGSSLELTVAKSVTDENSKNKRINDDVPKDIDEPLYLKMKTWVRNESCNSSSSEKKLQSPSLVTDHNLRISDHEACVLYKKLFNIDVACEDNKNHFPDIIPSETKSTNLSLQTLESLAMKEDSLLQDKDVSYNIDCESSISHSELKNDVGIDLACGETYNASLKKKNGSLGLNIYKGRDKQIYIHSLIAGGAAEHHELIRPGDKVLEVNGISLCKGIEYQQVVSLLRESSSVTELVLERGNPNSLDPLEELRSVFNTIRASELPNSEALDKSTSLSYSDVNILSNSISTEVTNCLIGENSQTMASVCNEYVAVSSNLRSSLTFDCDYEEDHNKRSGNKILETSPPIASDFKMVHRENPLHVLCAKDSILNSQYTFASEILKNSDCCSQKLVNFPLCTAVEINKNSAISANGVQSSPNTTKVVQKYSDCNLKDISKPLTSYNSTPNLIDESDDDDDNEICNQRENSLFRNKSSDCLLSSIPYFEINLLNTCHEYEENHNSVPSEISIPPRKKKFKKLHDIYNYLNSENTFIVTLKKGTRGLGFSISGGRDSSKKDVFSQLIRIRKLYPLQPAMLSEQLFVGDIILQVNSVKMVGLTNNEALEILRCVSSSVTIKVFRPSSCNFPSLSICKDLLPIFLDSPPSSTCSSLSGNLSEMNSYNDLGEFKITLMKKNGSLGFTVSRNEGVVDSHPLGIYVKALVREPAISDGRIHPGDRILQVNGTDISLMTHKEAVTFLRNAPELVTLTLFRSDPPYSPNGLDDDEHMSKPLRWEALELLNDRSKHKDGDSPFDKKKMKKKANKNQDGTSSSSVESSSSSSKKNETEQKDSSFDVLFHSNITLNTEHSGMQRCQRPKSLDVLNSSDRKQISEDEDNFHRQTSVTVVLTNQKNKNFEDTVNDGCTTKKGVKTLLKWRGSSFPADSSQPLSAQISKSENSICDYSIDDSPIFNNQNLSSESPISNHESDAPFDSSRQENIKQVQTVDISLDRGWHGRLGFSLQDPSIDENNPSMVNLPYAPEVSIVHPNTLAAKDGRIRIGDRLIEVNSESFLGKPAVEAIDILRKTRGLVRMVFSRL